MPFIETTDPVVATGKLAEIFTEIAAARGRVANIYKLHSLDPDALRAHRDLYFVTMLSRAGLSRREREAIATAVSAANECHY